MRKFEAEKFSPIYERMKVHLDRLGLSDEAASLKSGRHRDAIRNIRRGRSKSPHLATLQDISIVLGCSVNYLLGIPEGPLSVLNDNEAASCKEKEIKRAVGKRIQWVRELKYTTKEMSEIIGINENELISIENGDIYPPLYVIISVSSRFKIPTDFLLMGRMKSEADYLVWSALKLHHPDLDPPPTGRGFCTDMDPF